MEKEIFCDGCGFQADYPELGVLMKRKDGKWFHKRCGMRETLSKQ